MSMEREQLIYIRQRIVREYKLSGWKVVFGEYERPVWDKIVRKGVEWREMARRYVVRSGKYRGMHYIFWDRLEWGKYLGDRFRCVDWEEVTPGEMGRIRESGEKVWILSSDGFVVEALGIKEYASGYIVDVCSGSGWLKYDGSRSGLYVGISENRYKDLFGYNMVSMSDALFVDLLIYGADLVEAYKLAYNTKDFRVNKLQVKRKLMQNSVLKYLVDRLKKIKGEDMLEQFNEEFIAKEIEEFFSKVKKGTLTHLQGISFIGKISGVIDSGDKKKIEMGEYDILPPLELPESKKQIEGGSNDI